MGGKLKFLQEAAQAGYRVILCFIGLSDAALSIERVAMRVSQGGHDVPDEKLVARYPRIQENLRLAIVSLPHVLVFDQSNLDHPYRLIAVFEHGEVDYLADPVPDWFTKLLPPNTY